MEHKDSKNNKKSKKSKFLNTLKEESLPEIEKPKIYQVWVKKYIGKRRWNKKYSDISSYCFLRIEKKDGKKKAVVGFMIGSPEPNTIPDLRQYRGLELLTDNEALDVKNYRRANNIYPCPV